MSQELTEKVADAIHRVNVTTEGLTYNELTRAMARAAIAVVREAMEEHRRMLHSQFEALDITREHDLLGIIIDRLPASPLGEQ